MASGDLTTTESVRTYLGIESADADAVLDGIVSASSAWAVGRMDWSATVAEWPYAEEAIPKDLEFAVRKHAAMEYRRRDRLGKGSESAGGESVAYSPDGGDWRSILDTLDRYSVLPFA